MKYIIVTGACGGIGKTIIDMLNDKGYGIWAIDKDVDLLENTFSKYSNVNIYDCDLSNECDIFKMMKYITRVTGPLSGLVHCAGINRFIPIHLIKQKQIDEVFRIHVYSAITMCSLLSKRGYSESGASIVLFSSVAAHEGSSGNSVYASAKSAIEGFVKSSANDFADRGIRINAVVPGDVDAGMFKRFLSQISEEQIEARKSKYPLGFGLSENISDMIEFLLTDKSSWITGQCYVIDGGHSVSRI